MPRRVLALGRAVGASAARQRRSAADGGPGGVHVARCEAVPLGLVGAGHDGQLGAASERGQQTIDVPFRRSGLRPGRCGTRLQARTRPRRRARRSPAGAPGSRPPPAGRTAPARSATSPGCRRRGTPARPARRCAPAAAAPAAAARPPGRSTRCSSASARSVSGTCSSTWGVRITSRHSSGSSMAWRSSRIMPCGRARRSPSRGS